MAYFEPGYDLTEEENELSSMYDNIVSMNNCQQSIVQLISGSVQVVTSNETVVNENDNKHACNNFVFF
jgi:hypothetical protein